MQPRKTNNYMNAYIEAADKYLQRSRVVDPQYVLKNYVNGFVQGIVTGECGDGYVFQLPSVPGSGPIKIDDKHFMHLLDALVAKDKTGLGKGKKRDLVFYFRDSQVTDTSIRKLAEVLKSPKCSLRFSVDLSGESNITEDGLKVLLNALKDPKCNMGFSIVLPRDKFGKELTGQIEEKIRENNENYSPDKGPAKKGWFAGRKASKPGAAPLSGASYKKVRGK